LPPAFDFPASPTVGQRYDTGTGIAYVWDGVAWKGEGGSTPLVNGQRVIVIPGNPAPGTNLNYTWTKPADLKALQVEIWGGGGASSSQATPGAGLAVATPGAGGGAYCKKLYQAADLNATEALVVASGANTPSGVGNAGSTSTFKGMTATGGAASPAGVVASAAGLATGGRAGGVATGGDVNLNGETGENGFWVVASAIYYDGAGGSGANGGPGGAATNAPPSNSSRPANPGVAPGGGAGGNTLNGTSAAVAGTPGAEGMAILTEYYYETDSIPNAPPFDDLAVAGRLTTGEFRIADQSHLTLVSTDHPMQIGPDTYLNLRFDPNSIQGMDNGVANAINFNYYGGDILLGDATGTSVVDLRSGQLKFPAAQKASADPNTIDDYEEGVFTPVIVGTTAAGVGTHTAQNGFYTKIGRLVQFELYVAWSAHTGTGNLRVAGLPFTVGGAGPALSIIPSILTFPAQLMAYPLGTQIVVITVASTAALVNVPMDTAASLNIAGTYTVA
jgi:hypothetical protein